MNKMKFGVEWIWIWLRVGKNKHFFFFKDAIDANMKKTCFPDFPYEEKAERKM